MTQGPTGPAPARQAGPWATLGLVAVVLVIVAVAAYWLRPRPVQYSATNGVVYGTVLDTGTAGGPGHVRLDSGAVVAAQVQPPNDPATDIPPSLLPRYRPGDHVMVAYNVWPDGHVDYLVADWQRGPALLWLLGLFLVVVALVGRAKGLRAVLGTGASLVLVLVFVVPAILRGADPVLAVLAGSGGILVLTMYFVHGLNWKTTAALAGTLATVAVALLTADVFLHAAHILSFGDEDSTYIAVADAKVSLQGLVLAGVVIGALGALVDVTIGQASTVAELAHLGPDLGIRQLYARAMNVGLDHIGSLVNTLVLAYVSSALPLILLITLQKTGWRQQISVELIAVQVIHTLVGAIALVLAVPLTTIIAAAFFRGDRLRDAGTGHGHSHLHGHIHSH